MRLSGWQRIGVVAFIIWSLVVWLKVSDSWRDPLVAQFTERDNVCLNLYSNSLEKDRAKSEKCYENSRNKYLSDLKEIYTRSLFWKMIAISILFPAFLLWGIITVVRWVIRGFTKA